VCTLLRYGLSNLTMAWLTACAVLRATFQISVNPVLRSTRLTMACRWFLPMTVSASQSPIRLRVSTLAGRSSMESRFGMMPRHQAFHKASCASSDETTGRTTSHLTNPAKNAGQVIGYSHSTRLVKNTNQVAGYGSADSSTVIHPSACPHRCVDTPLIQPCPAARRWALI
jgi:hypothetical protein